MLLGAWKRQRFRNRCHDRSASQSSNVRGQRENARSAYYHDGKREEHFLRHSHLLTHFLICLSALNALSGALLAQPIASNGFRTVASGSQNGFVESTIIHHRVRLSSASRACAKIGSSTSSTWTYSAGLNCRHPSLRHRLRNEAAGRNMIVRRLRHSGPGREAMSGDGSLSSIDDSAT